MKNNLFNIRLKRMFRDNNNTFSLIINIICSFVIFSILIFIINLYAYVDKSINSNVGFRTIKVPPSIVYPDIDYTKINDIKNVIMQYDSGYTMITLETNFKNNKYDGFINLTFDPDNKYFSKEDSYVAICPENFYPDVTNMSINLKKNDFINGKELINKEFIVKYFSKKNNSNIETKFKIIGVYDNSENMNYNNTCYIPYNDLENIIDDKLDIKNSYSKYDISIVVNDIKNVDYVIQELKKIGFDNNFIETQYNIDYKMINNLSYISLLISVITFIMMVLIIIMYSVKKINRESNNIGLLKVLGYQNNKIKNIYLLEIFIFNIISISIGLVISYILFIICKYLIFKGLSYIGIIIIFPYLYVILFYLILNIIFVIIVYLVIKKKIKLQLCDLKREL